LLLLVLRRLLWLLALRLLLLLLLWLLASLPRQPWPSTAAPNPGGGVTR
jgi:hypothetical protein